jgi:uncharacterized membrane protein
MKFQLERIALFSDAVFAIAITLMMIEIKPPHLHPGDSFIYALRTFIEVMPTFVGTILSFLLIGMFWKKHHELMKYMVAYNNKVLALNLGFLLSIAFIPFSTAFVFENIQAASPLPLLIYNINYIVATILGYQLFSYILDPKNSLCEDEHGKDMTVLKRETMYHIFVYALVAVIAFISPAYAAIGYPLLAFENRWVARKAKQQLAN